MKCLDRVTDKIAKKIPVVGTHVSGHDSTMVEYFGLSGYDFVWIDGEHPSMTIETVQHHVMAAQGTGMAAFYRVPWNDPILAKPALDMGVDGIIFPMIRTAEEAEKAVAACRYPPKGIRGWGPLRDSGYGKFDSDWQKENAEKMWKIMQIEHIQAVENFEKIAAVDGVDAITVGCADLSTSMGYAGHPEHPEVKKVLDILGEKCRKAGLPFSVSSGPFDAQFVEEWINRGVNWIVSGNEYCFMSMGMDYTRKYIDSCFAKRDGK